MAGNLSSGNAPTEPFINKWPGQENGQEAANCALFLTELRDGLGLPQAAGPLDANAVAARFKQGRHIVAKVAAVLAAVRARASLTARTVKGHSCSGARRNRQLALASIGKTNQWMKA